MSSSKQLLFGTESTRSLRFWAVPLAVFVVTFAAYATDTFAVSGGVVWVPGDAALVGLVYLAVIALLVALVGFALGRGTRMGKMRVFKAGESFGE